VITQCDERGLQFDQTIFYPAGGGQPGDTGFCKVEGGQKIMIADTVKDRDSGEHLHCISGDDQNSVQIGDLNIGDTVQLELDWERRYRLMRMHSCLHMLCATIPAPVTGGSIQDGRGRLDFDLPETIDKEAVTRSLNELVDGDHPMSMRWITDDELAANPELVRTMSAPPPTGTGKVRLVNFEGIDLQPCGGTHVASTAEIGKVRVQKVEKKGKLNRRIVVVFDE